MSCMPKLIASTILCSMAFMLSDTASAMDDINPDELLNLSLEQLSNIEVTSVSKRSEKASEAAGAIFVITQDDIRRSGHTSIPELLRMVPGLSVAQSSSHGWVITSRGTSNQFANKLLVLMDGRSVYTPLFSGVYWDAQDTILQDIERIEVIRGPGATLWGANAVNGVINIITKGARDSQGGLLSQTVGTLNRSLTSIRYGGKIGNNDYARIYAKYDDRASIKNMAGHDVQDDWNKAQSGFRADGTHSDNITYTLQGDAYRSGESYVFNIPNAASAPTFIDIIPDREISRGANLLGRLNYKDSSNASWTLQAYYDYAYRNNLVLENAIHTFDIDLQRTWSEGLHDIVWGMAYRLITDWADVTFYDFLVPDHRVDNLFSAFIQDKIALVPEEFFLTLGSKFEHNDYTGFELQPSARLTWLIDNKQTWWSSASHAVRTPNRFSETGSVLLDAASTGGAAYVGTVPNADALSEVLNAYEMGYRIEPNRSVALDIAIFYNDYSRLITNSVGAPTAINVPGFGLTPVVPITPINGNSGTTTGIEVAGSWEASDTWRLNAAYTRLNFTLKNAEQAGFTVKGNSPQNQFNLRSTLNLPHNLELNNALYYVDELKGINIPSYVRFDVRLAWKPIENLEVSLVGQNLFDRRHPEFTGFIYQNAAQVPRAYYGNITWKF